MRSFRPPLLLTVAAAALVALTLKLAFWQFDRAEQKRALEAAAASAASAAAMTMEQPQPVAPFTRAALIGRYLADGALLLDNRVRNRRAGYHVLAPFQLAEGGVVMVNRGWLAASGSRQQLPAIPPPPPGRITVQGVFYSDGADSFRLSSAPARGAVRQHIDLAAYAEESGLPLLPLLLIKEADADALPAATLRLDYKSAQSTVYAWQWLTFCLLTVVFYFILATRRKK